MGKKVEIYCLVIQIYHGGIKSFGNIDYRPIIRVEIKQTYVKEIQMRLQATSRRKIHLNEVFLAKETKRSA